MTTPSSPTLSASTDKASYAPGEVVTLTAIFSDTNTQTLTVTVTAQATDAAGNVASATTQFNSVITAPEPMTVTASDDHGDVYTQVADDGAGTVVFQTTAPSA